MNKRTTVKGPITIGVGLANKDEHCSMCSQSSKVTLFETMVASRDLKTLTLCVECLAKVAIYS